ncbi:isochorismatase family protein [Streptomyces phaeochromogenes]|uniref:isochorismatase family protein n=1 Tax=Streptomyces phaeochromogenes TaxID=1923 RepID=UPI002259FB7F|nr:isochorismatase family protein [Streptomyces phaeochromogenes]MCX5603514.1 isochorismatase family protein [Streptomyces phaeochromogenes]
MPHASALLVLDMQNAAVAISHRPKETVTTIALLQERARAAGVPVITVQHDGPGLEPGTEAWRTVPELAPGEGEKTVRKGSADAFLDSDLGPFLTALGVTEVVVTGFATEFCVDSTARQALSRGYDLVLVADGHTTSARPDVDGFVASDRAVMHHNAIYRHIGFPGRSIRVLPAADVDFTAPPVPDPA